MKRSFEVTIKKEDEVVFEVVEFHEEQVMKKAKNWSPLHEMACLGELASEDEFDDSINDQDINGCTPLMWAVSEGNFSVAETLIDCGADVNSQNFYGETPLFLASARGNNSLCQLLLESGANPNIPNSEGVYPVHMAVANGFHEIVTLLCSRGAFMNVKDDAGDTLLHYAVREGQRALVQYLVNYCDKSSSNEDKETALELANELHEVEIAQLLSAY